MIGHHLILHLDDSVQTHPESGEAAFTIDRSAHPMSCDIDPVYAHLLHVAFPYRAVDLCQFFCHFYCIWLVIVIFYCRWFWSLLYWGHCSLCRWSCAGHTASDICRHLQLWHWALCWQSECFSTWADSWWSLSATCGEPRAHYSFHI